MTYIDETHCPVVWKCHRINEDIYVDPEAIYDVKNGWQCKCNTWVKKNTKEHEIQLWGLRKGFASENSEICKCHLSVSNSGFTTSPGLSSEIR